MEQYGVYLLVATLCTLIMAPIWVSQKTKSMLEKSRFPRVTDMLICEKNQLSK